MKKALVIMFLFPLISLAGTPKVDYTPGDKPTIDYTPSSTDKELSYDQALIKSKETKMPLLVFVGVDKSWNDKRFISCKAKFVDGIQSSKCIVMIHNNKRTLFGWNATADDIINSMALQGVSGDQNCPNGNCPVPSTMPNYSCPGGVCPVPQEYYYPKFFRR